MKRRFNFSPLLTDSGKEKFRQICCEETAAEQNLYSGGIGTLGEKRMHRVLKRCITEDLSCHEVKVSELPEVSKKGGFVADVFKDGEIFEIQTGGFYPLVKKLSWYFDNTPFFVTVICPVASKKTLSWISPETGEVGKPRLVSKKESVKTISKEIFWLRPFIQNEETQKRLRIVVMELEVHEYRWQNGYGEDKKIRARRFERIPAEIENIVVLQNAQDYEKHFLPENISYPFTAAEYSSKAKIRGKAAYAVLGLLCELQILEISGKIGRASAYKMADICKDKKLSEGEAK